MIVGDVEAVLGPVPCRACRTRVVWGVATQSFREQGGEGRVRRRDLYEASTGLPHRCDRAACDDRRRPGGDR